MNQEFLSKEELVILQQLFQRVVRDDSARKDLGRTENAKYKKQTIVLEKAIRILLKNT